MKLSGKNIIGTEVLRSEESFVATSPLDGTVLDGRFEMAGVADVDTAIRLALVAFESFGKSSGTSRADFLERIAAEIELLGDDLLQRAHLETGLPLARLTGERGRTVTQLKMFAALAREGSWVDARIDVALPLRQPLPRCDLRRMLVPLGPVIVFGSSNFPLAFSVAGGDTASALATGNPVLVKAHRGHPGTSELVALAVRRAVPAGHADSYPLDMLSEILNDRTGRLYLEMVEGRGIASSVATASDTRKYAGLFAFEAQTRGDSTPQTLEQAWYDVLEKLQKEPIGERELRKVKNRVAAGNYRRLQSNMSLLIQLAFVDTLLDWREINDGPKKYEAVTAEQIQQVAQKYFGSTNRSVATYQRETAEINPTP